MIYAEIETYDIHHNPDRVVDIVETNAQHFANDLYILHTGNNFKFDKDTLAILMHLKKRIEQVLWEGSV